MTKFPVDAPKARAVEAFESLGVRLVREGNHIGLMRRICTQASIARDDFLKASEKT